MKKVFIAICICLVFTGKALAWGKEGHTLVAKIAELGLTDKTKAELKKLGFEHIGTADVAAYADRVRRNRDYPEYMKTGPWHFIDLPVGEIPTANNRGLNDVKVFVKRHEPNVVTQIYYFQDVLKDSKASEKDKQEAVKFLVHFVGDIHQPLHCADRHDHGGNGLKVTYLGHGGKWLNLHHVWDTNLVKDLIGKKGLDTTAQEWFNGFDEDYVDDTVNDEDGHHGSLIPEVWAYESYIEACDCAYREHGGHGELKWLPTSGHPNLDETYVKTAKVVVQTRIEKAGIRLATVLNNIFDADGPGFNYSHK